MPYRRAYQPFYKTAYTKCVKCGKTLFTHHVKELLSVINAQQEDISLKCHGCKQPLDYLEITLCSSDIGSDKCGSCTLRFFCYSSSDEIGVLDKEI